MSTTSDQGYRATKLWNDIKQKFYQGMVLGRHRRYMRSYDDCFVASEAINWLHTELKNNPNFGPHVTRASTLLLLQKFYKFGVFEDVRGSKEKEVFGDNGRLYRFCHNTPKKALGRTPLCALNSLPEEISSSESIKPVKPVVPSIKQQISPQQIEEVWKTMLLGRLSSVLQLTHVEDIVDVDYINTQNIIHNMTHLNSSGLVTNIAKQDQLPPWVLSAMKCLAHWPEKIEDSAPSYPGFEFDVFMVIKNYFESLEEPLITYNMYDIFTAIYVRAEKTGQRTRARQASYASVENLMLNLTMQDKCEESYQGAPPPHTSRSHAIHQPGELPPAPHRSHTMSSHSKYTYQNNTPSLPVSATIETSFGVDNIEPRTRIYSSTGQSESGYNSVDRNSNTDSNRYSSIWSVDSRSMEDERRFGQRCLSMTDINNVVFPENELRKHERVESWVSVHSQEVDGAEDLVDAEELDTLNYGFTVALSTTPHKQPSDHNYCNQGYSASQYVLGESSRDSCRQPPPYVPPPSYTSIQPVRPLFRRCSSTASSYETAHSHLSQEITPVQRPLQHTKHSEITKSRTSLTESYRLAMQCHDTTPVGKSLFSSLRRAESSPSIFSAVTKTRMQDALQMCCLLLPPANRRKLHLLLRLMWRMSHNEELVIDQDVSIRQLVLETFSRSILCGEAGEYDSPLAEQMVAFMMDHHQEIMAVPADLKLQITERVNHLQQVRCKLLSPSSLAYCEQVSVRTYEEQRLSISQRALIDLLDNIISNTNIPSKDRKKRLKQFQKSHPDIYAQRFPTASRSETHLSKKPSIKPPLLSRPLRKLKSMKSIRL